MTESQTLLTEYAENGSESAFRGLVERYINLVYGAALRLVDGNRQLAEDVTQIVFINLAKKGRTLPREVTLGGWLHQNTYHVAKRAMRAEHRRLSREREAMEMNMLRDDFIADGRQVAPILDEAITQLGIEDRTAIMLRFFEQRDFRSVGEALGSSEDAARMRVNRALEKLHSLLKRRGVTLSIAGLGTVLLAGAVTAAPAGLAGSVSKIALGGAAAGTGTLLTISKLMANAKFKLGLVTLLVAGAASTLVVQHQSQAKLRDENKFLRQQIAQLKADLGNLSNVDAQAQDTASMSTDQTAELLRLRGEVGALRLQSNELARLQKENQELLSRGPAQSEPTNQVSADDQFILRQTHAVATMTALLQAMKTYATNHGGQFPLSFDQMAASGALAATNFTGNLGPDDFQIEKNAFDWENDRIILSLRNPILRPGQPPVTVLGEINDDGLVRTKTVNVTAQ